MAVRCRWRSILLDVMLPNMDGIELVRQLGQLLDLQQTPVVFLTGHLQPERSIATEVAMPIARQFGEEVLQALVIGQQHTGGPGLVLGAGRLERFDAATAERRLLPGRDAGDAEAVQLNIHYSGEDTDPGPPIVLAHRKARGLLAVQPPFAAGDQQRARPPAGGGLDRSLPRTSARCRHR